MTVSRLTETIQHTPGPWTVEQAERQYVITGCDESYDIAIVRAVSDRFDNAANARLIAAAPDLLEALEQLVAHQNGCPLPKYEEGWNAAMKSAEAAIAKARGR